MHRTTTTATLLVTVAVTALSGCVTVHRPPASGQPPAAPAGSAPAFPGGRAEPQIVQAPAREALERVGPAKKPKPAAPPRQRAAPPPQGAPATPVRPRPHPTRPAPRPKPRHPEPRSAVPPVSPDLPKSADVCALGRTYGGWKADSPEAVICSGAYGN
ncbi:hypothetical protein AB0912_27125 [Streptomyces sp. NPDC007084]|uniref:hypothetical protein n=1 Tax=Streptomyces sp. NPDC007084 TaxID=3154313 RepID=UPI003451882F